MFFFYIKVEQQEESAVKKILFGEGVGFKRKLLVEGGLMFKLWPSKKLCSYWLFFWMEKNHNNEHEVILLEHIGKQLKSYFLPNDLSGLCWEQSFNSFITVIKKLVIISGLLHVLCAMTHSFFESHNPVYFLSTPFLSRPPFLKYSPIKDQLHLCSCNPLSLSLQAISF